ncbi:MAG: HAD family phosphatase [bacterium]|nr:HAD family phosphatase [bacterium]
MSYDAILFDLDGTLLDSNDSLHPANLEAIHAAEQAGAKVLLATGRSKMATVPVLERIGLTEPVVVFNGAAVWCPRESRMLEERTLSNRALERLHAFGELTGDLMMVQCADKKLVSTPRNAYEERALQGLHGLEAVPRDELRVDYTIRVTFLTDSVTDSAEYQARVEEALDLPAYFTHFPLSVLPMHRESKYHAVDVHPPCRGKAEALRVLDDHFGIPAERVVAVGDASNDVPMVRAAGLGVAMENSMRELLDVADRVIGHHDEPVIAELVRELFL